MEVVKLKVLHLNTHTSGATFRYAYQFHKFLRSKGHESTIIVARSYITEDGVINMSSKRILKLGISGLTQSFLFRGLLGDRNYYFYPDWNLDLFSAKRILQSIPYVPDAIILYWVKFFITPKILYELQQISGAPIYWVLMDMAPFTGGCSYAFGCKGYVEKCGFCPALKANREYDLSRKTWVVKKQVFDNIDITVISGTSTLTKQVKASSLLGTKNIESVMLGVDSKIFNLGNKTKSREKLGLPLDRKIIFLVLES